MRHRLPSHDGVARLGAVRSQTRRAAIAGLLTTGGLAAAGAWALGRTRGREAIPDQGSLLVGEDLAGIEEAAADALPDVRIVLEIGRPFRFPYRMPAMGIGGLNPRQAVKLRALAESGILILEDIGCGQGPALSIAASAGLEYDPGTGVFRSVGRRLVGLWEARWSGGPDGCCCLATSAPKWPGGTAPSWAGSIAASRAFPEFDGDGVREDALFFERSAGTWRLSQATMPSFARRLAGA